MIRGVSPGRSWDCSSVSNVEVKNAWSHTSIPQDIFRVWCSVKKSTGTTLYIYIYIYIYIERERERERVFSIEI
jgi:hypothetical protein